MARHDSAYKLLFSHPQIVRDLLRGFVREEWVDQLDYDSLERVNGSYVSDDLRARASDVVWRVRWRKQWVYIYLLLEFQSTRERYMAVRMLAYVSLLYQDLVRGKALCPSGRLPPVLPIVLYNGAQRWQVARDLAALMHESPRALKKYLPQARYLLIDEKHLVAGDDDRGENLVTALFRLENSRTKEDVKRALDALIARLPDDDQSGLRRSFSTWVEETIMPRVQGGLANAFHDNALHDIKEIRSMLSETIQRWKMEYRRDGMLAGRRQGLKEGRAKGQKLGLRQGMREGKRRGMQEGKREGQREGMREGRAQLLLRVMRKRFGPLPGRLQARVRQATPKQLDAWAEKVLDAPNIQAMMKRRAG